MFSKVNCFLICALSLLLDIISQKYTTNYPMLSYLARFSTDIVNSDNIFYLLFFLWFLLFSSDTHWAITLGYAGRYVIKKVSEG